MPETANCSINGLADGAPVQAEILPITFPVIMVGEGFTVMENLTGKPVQPVADTGVAVMVATTAPVVVFITLNGAMSPVPFAARPIPGLLLTQLTVAPGVIKKVTPDASLPFVNTWFDTGPTTGNAFTVPVTPMAWFAAPVEVSVTLPDILPVGADEADRT